MAEAFVRAGHQVVYWTSDFSHARKGMREEGTGNREQGTGIRVECVPTIPYVGNVGFSRICSHHAYAKKWFRLATDLQDCSPFPVPSSLSHPSLIVSSCPTLSAAAAALKVGRALGAKVVIDVQDAWPETFERLAPKGLRWLARLALTPLRMKARRIYREADLVTGVCDAYRSLTCRDDYFRAYLGIDSGEARSYALNKEQLRGPSSSKIRLVYAGGLGKTYDLKTLVKAVEANKEMTLDVAGFGDFASDCPRVKFHGALSAADLQKLLSTCDIGVIPMNAASGVGLPNKIFDYAAAGLGVISSLGGESAALLKRYKCGATYRPGDVASLTAAIRQVTTFERGASRQMCEREFEAMKIYDAYVKRVCA